MIDRAGFVTPRMRCRELICRRNLKGQNDSSGNFVEAYFAKLGELLARRPRVGIEKPRRPGEGRYRGIERISIIGIRVQETDQRRRSEEHTSELQSLMRISYAVFCLKKKRKI